MILPATVASAAEQTHTHKPQSKRSETATVRQFRWNPSGTPSQNQELVGQKVTAKSLILWRTQEDSNL